jgi:homocysteine S-methyltransferase
MLFLDGGSTAIKTFLPKALPPTSSSLWTSIYCQTAPDAVLQWHSSFLDADADIITTNTYQIPLSGQTKDEFIPSLVRAAVSLAQQAIQRHKKGSIALSLGSRNAHAGKGEYSTDPQGTVAEYMEFHRSRITEWHGLLEDVWDTVSYLAFETVSSFDEASAILRVLDEVECTFGKKSWITFSCGDGSISRMEEIMSRLVRLDTSRLWGIGFNCVGIDIVHELGKMLARKIQELDLVMVIYPDAGSWSERNDRAVHH